MMVEYTHLPDGIVTTVLPEHYHVEVSSTERERMMETTQRYSKVSYHTKKRSLHIWCFAALVGVVVVMSVLLLLFS